MHYVLQTQAKAPTSRPATSFRYEVGDTVGLAPGITRLAYGGSLAKITGPGTPHGNLRSFRNVAGSQSCMLYKYNCARY